MAGYDKGGKKARKWDVMRDNDELKFAIKYRMERMGWSVKRLAKETNIDRSTISSYLNNDYYATKYRMPDHRELMIIADILDLDVKLDVKFRVIQEENRRTSPGEPHLRRAKWRIGD